MPVDLLSKEKKEHGCSDASVSTSSRAHSGKEDLELHRGGKKTKVARKEELLCNELGMESSSLAIAKENPPRLKVNRKADLL